MRPRQTTSTAATHSIRIVSVIVTSSSSAAAAATTTANSRSGPKNQLHRPTQSRVLGGVLKAKTRCRKTCCLIDTQTTEPKREYNSRSAGARGRNATNVSCVVPKSNFKNKRLLRWNSHFIANRRSVQLHHSLLVVKISKKKKQSGDSKETRKPKTTNSNMLIKRREKQRNCLLVIILPNVCKQTELTHTSAELYCYSAEKRNIIKLKRCVTWKVYN